MSKTVVHLIPGLYLGGSEKVLEIIATHQKSQGNKVVIVCFGKTRFEKFYQEMELVHIDVVYRDSLLSKGDIRIDQYENAIDEIQPNVIHSHSYWTDLISHRNLRMEVCYISHFHLCYDYFDNVRLKKSFYHEIFRWVDKRRLLKKYKQSNCILVAASRTIAAFYEERLPKTVGSKIRLMPNPVQDHYFSTQRDNIKYDLLTIGRLETVKNQELFIKILVQLKEFGIKPNSAIVGEGSLKGYLMKMVELNGLGETVSFLGGVKDLKSIFSVSDLYIHTARSETFGLAIMEAMAAGLPVITSAFAGIDNQLIVNNDNALIIDDENLLAFVDAIILLKKDKALAKKLSGNGKLTADKFSSVIYLKAMDELYESIGNFSSI